MRALANLYLLILLLLNSQELLAADTLFVSHNLPIKPYGFINLNGDNYIINKLILPKFNDSIGIFSEFDRQQNNDVYSMLFRKCTFEDSKVINLNKTTTPLNGNFVFDRCALKDLTLNKIRGDLDFYYSYASNLSILNSNRLRVKFENITSSEITINQCSDLYLEFVNHFNNESSRYTVSNSNIKFLKFNLSDNYGSFNYSFNNDTITNLQFDNGVKEDNRNYQFEGISNEIIFTKCYIANAIDFQSRAPDTKIKFIDCSFGPNFNLTNIRIDKLALDFTHNISKPLKISFAADSIWGQVSLINTDLSQLEIAWTDKVWLYFDSIETTEIINRTFSQILDKYRAEIKTDSYKRIDLMRHFYTENTLIWNLDENWWGHSYKKELVFCWTVILLSFFTIINFIWWPRMQEVYPLFSMQRTFSLKSKQTYKSFFASFIYSNFIFFSLSIKLDKLKLAKTIFVIVFLGQYLIGLFTLLFIVNFILKL